jgi:monomeric isocitrate dehydrogenase
MLSIVPLLAGGVLLETGAGGSAPKHVEQATDLLRPWSLALLIFVSSYSSSLGGMGGGVRAGGNTEEILKSFNILKVPSRGVTRRCRLS